MKRIMLIAVALAGVLFGTARLVPEEFVVAPKAVRWWRFQINATERIVGRFHAQGGSGNDIITIVASWDDCENIMNGHGGNSYYFSGKVTNGSFNLLLGPGDYCVAFSNKMSPLTAKEVEATIVRTVP